MTTQHPLQALRCINGILVFRHLPFIEDEVHILARCLAEHSTQIVPAMTWVGVKVAIELLIKRPTVAIAELQQETQTNGVIRSAVLEVLLKGAAALIRRCATGAFQVVPRQAQLIKGVHSK